MITVVADCYLAGVSTRRMDKLVKTLGIHSLSKSQVSRMAAELDEHVEQFRHRPLGEAGPFTFVAADALTMKVREGGRVINAVVLVATGVNADGRREVLGLRVATSETGAAWNSFFADLVARGLGGVRLVTSDAHQGLVEAIAANLPGAVWQRCRTHYAANLMSVTPKAMWPAVKAMLHSVYDQPDADAVHAQFDRLLDYVDGKLPDAFEHLDNARADILAFTGFPDGLWQQIWSNNPNGAPFAAPAGAFAGGIDAPGGLGGPLTNAAMQVLPVGDEVGADPDLILATHSAEGVVLAETEVTRVERSEGTKGLRVVLQQKNNVFTIEDPYTASEGGKRQFRFGDYSNQPALDVQNALAFITSSSPPNTVYVRRKGAPPLTATVDPNWNIDFPDVIREVLEGVAVPVDALARLQQHTGTIIRVPDLTETTFAQVAEWRRAATILEGKEVIAAYPEGHALGVELPAEVDTIPGLLAIDVPLEVTIGEQTIHFGTARMWIEDATILERREIDGRSVHWLTTPNRRVRFSLPKDLADDTAG
jgi:hypothetical protein